MMRLTAERQKRGWSKAHLARKATIDQAMLSKVEAGRMSLYPRQLRRLARALGLPSGEAERLLDELAE